MFPASPARNECDEADEDGDDFEAEDETPRRAAVASTTFWRLPTPGNNCRCRISENEVVVVDKFAANRRRRDEAEDDDEAMAVESMMVVVVVAAGGAGGNRQRQ